MSKWLASPIAAGSTILCLTAAQVVPPVATVTAQRAGEKPATRNRCGFHFDVTGLDGKVSRSKSASMGVVGGEVLFWLTFEKLPDPEIVSASKQSPKVTIGGFEVAVRRVDPSAFRFEKAGDSRPIYMREAPVLRIGATWFIGDRIDFDPKYSAVTLGVDDEFISLFQESRNFEIWWKGTRRMTAQIVPDELSPAELSTECLPLPAAIREQVRRGKSNQTMRKHDPSPIPHLLSFISLDTDTRLRSNLFDVTDETAGSATFRVTVGRDGLVKQCDLISQSGKRPGRQAACESVRTFARFHPATDSSGMLIEAETTLALDWNPQR